MGSLPSATMVCWARIVVFAGACFGRAQNNPTRAKAVSRASTTLFIGGASSAGFLMRRKYMSPPGDCNCEVLWKMNFLVPVEYVRDQRQPEERTKTSRSTVRLNAA